MTRKSRARLLQMTVIPPVLPPAAVEPDRFTITLPIPPSINHQYATVNGRRILSAAGRRYKVDIGQQILVALSHSTNKQLLLLRLRSDYVALSIRCRFMSLLHRDIDGGLKITQDAVCEALGLNDNRVLELHLYKELAAESPSMELTLSILASPPCH
ncbi:RusA family crossover junction endodeoxyribonuclease [Nitrospira sp. Nam74]